MAIKNTVLIFDPHLSIVKSVFDCGLSDVKQCVSYELLEEEEQILDSMPFITIAY